ncbi:serine/threonine-protein kinase TAO1-like protein [Aphelenchoides avenae]|nr:serine/threonine-protein kinase TAO1-like protein [Aphelenchus avenae]
MVVGRNCEVKLADLDAAADKIGSPNGDAGNPHWLAPEVASVVCGQSTDPYTAKVDVWSFAIFAAEFSLRVPPYFTDEEDTDVAEICGTICNPKYVDCVNEMMRAANCPDVARLVEFCLKANPTERPSMSDVLALMSVLPEPDQQVLLEPMQRMVQRRAEALKAADRDGSFDRGAATAGDDYDSFESQ